VCAVRAGRHGVWFVSSVAYLVCEIGLVRGLGVVSECYRLLEMPSMRGSSGVWGEVHVARAVRWLLRAETTVLSVRSWKMVIFERGRCSAHACD
jgi:hypothetical protein